MLMWQCEGYRGSADPCERELTVASFAAVRQGASKAERSSSLPGALTLKLNVEPSRRKDRPASHLPATAPPSISRGRPKSPSPTTMARSVVDPPFAAPRRIRRCGRDDSTRTSETRNPAISLTRNPQQQAKRTRIRFPEVFAEFARWVSPEISSCHMTARDLGILPVAAVTAGVGPCMAVS